MAKKSFKRDKYQDRLLGEVNTFLRTKFSDKRLQFVSFTKVELSGDYSSAILYWDTFDAATRGDAHTAVESIAGRLRSLLAEALNVRAVPSLELRYDSQYEAEKAIDDLLNKEAKEGRYNS
jgi:ribosome-binding factor A